MLDNKQERKYSFEINRNDV